MKFLDYSVGVHHGPLIDGNPNVVIKWEEVDFYIFRKDSSDWILLPPDNSYMREQLIGQGNNCMTEITVDDAKEKVKGLLKNGLHTKNKACIENLF